MKVLDEGLGWSAEEGFALLWKRFDSVVFPLNLTPSGSLEIKAENLHRAYRFFSS